MDRVEVLVTVTCGRPRCGELIDERNLPHRTANQGHRRGGMQLMSGFEDQQSVRFVLAAGPQSCCHSSRASRNNVRRHWPASRLESGG